MSDKRVFMALARVIIAVAWVDGEISNEEVNSLKDLLYRLPGTGYEGGIQLTAQEWKRLDMYMESPVGPDERERLVAELQSAIRTQADKELAMQALRNLAGADGDASDEERAVLAEIEASLGDVGTGIIGALGRLVGSSVDERTAAVANAPNREAYFDDFLRNKVYYSLRQHAPDAEVGLDLSEREQRRLGLAGGLMAKVAHIDGEVSDEEFDAITNAIERYWQLDHAEASYVAEVALSAIDRTYDTLRMMRELAEMTTEDERRRFLTALFAVAAADGDISHDEHEEIRFIARGIMMAHEDFINAKLTVLGREEEEGG
jgi:uncharacterized tellurite resistance protein B-like protein